MQVVPAISGRIKKIKKGDLSVSAYHRYSFTKSVYPNYLVLLLKKDKYYSYGRDRKVLEYLKFKNKTYILKKKKINYLVLDELDIIEKNEYSDNMLDKYIYLTYLKEIFNEIKVVMSSKYDLL